MDKKKIWRLLCLVLIVWGTVKIFPGIFANIMFLWFNLKANFSPNDAYSVGIIGGADGPTAIFFDCTCMGALSDPGAGHCGGCSWISQTQKTEIIRERGNPLLIFLLRIS